MEIRVPRVNANEDEAKVTAWHAVPWQPVAAGDAVCSIETTKATVDVHAEAAGFFYPAAHAGATVTVGQVLAWVFPEKSAELLEQAQKSLAPASLPAAPSHVVISAKARALMAEHRLTAAQFPDLSAISANDIETFLRAQRSETPRADEVIRSLSIDEQALLIWGAGYQGQVALDILQDRAGDRAGDRAVVIVDSRSPIPELYGVPVLRPEHLPQLRRAGLRKAHVCIGSASDKIEVAGILKSAGFSLVNIVHSSAVVSARARLGEGVFVGPLVLIGAGAVIGDLCQLNNAASIAHHSELGRAVAVSDGARLGSNVRVGEGTLIGIGTGVNSRVSVGKWCTLVSGTTLYSDVGDGTVVRADGSRVHRTAESAQDGGGGP